LVLLVLKESLVEQDQLAKNQPLVVLPLDNQSVSNPASVLMLTLVEVN
jgi:hypothetical protein